MTRDLRSFVLNDQHTFCTRNGDHNSDGLKLRQIFNINDKKNMHRIEDGIYPEKAKPTIHVTDILHQVCPPNFPLLKSWSATKAFIDEQFLRPDYGPETCVFIIVTGHWRGVSGFHHNGGVWVDVNDMTVDCHFDDFDSLAVLVNDEKTFLMFSSDDLDCDLSTNSSTG